MFTLHVCLVAQQLLPFCTNNHDVVEQGGFLLSLALPEQDRFHDDKADILDLNGLAETWQFTLRPGERPSDELLAFLRLLNLSGAYGPMVELVCAGMIALQ